MTSLQKWALLITCMGVGAVSVPRMVQSHHIQPQRISSTDPGAGQHSHHQKHDHHQKLEISAKQAPPTVDLVVHPDQVKGWNLELQVTNFAFAPTRVNAPSTADEGHAHLYVNGKKVTRLYGNWYYLPELPPGPNTLKVTLNSNGHESLVYRGQPISDTEMIQVAPQP
ncbi:hypothetical protein [Acaryochloris sp. IP29b_bin.148]|uniref:hypothetical protein n=1 Tax=Acaryochloris sp. IP29b_bin.148 TaxID=2969218 RepID=UPI002613B6FA|nr:hypothetical protein [Acaryochloris sp. IP29b_bin.148]